MGNTDETDDQYWMRHYMSAVRRFANDEDATQHWLNTPGTKRVHDLNGFQLEQVGKAFKLDTEVRHQAGWIAGDRIYVTREEWEKVQAMSIRGGMNIPVNRTGGPHCPVDGALMVHDAAKAHWKCPTKDCTQVARRKDAVAGVQGAVLQAQDIEVVIGPDQKHYLYLRKQEIMVDLEPVLFSRTTGPVHAGNGKYHVGLEFESARRIDKSPS